MKKVKGFYNAKFYCLEVDGKEVYRAGNSPFCSQTYVSTKDGVGLATMERYCRTSAAETAEEIGGTVEEITFLDM
jgi:hypothetical protein